MSRLVCLPLDSIRVLRQPLRVIFFSFCLDNFFYLCRRIAYNTTSFRVDIVLYCFFSFLFVDNARSECGSSSVDAFNEITHFASFFVFAVADCWQFSNEIQTKIDTRSNNIIIDFLLSFLQNNCRRQRNEARSEMLTTTIFLSTARSYRGAIACTAGQTHIGDRRRYGHLTPTIPAHRSRFPRRRIQRPPERLLLLLLLLLCQHSLVCTCDCL
jgi:hypothetical protein